MTPDWHSISPDPVSAPVRAFLRSQLRQRRARAYDFNAFLQDFVAGRSVLDVGAVAHDEGHVASDEWNHGKIKRWAARTVGVDVLPEQVAVLQQQGLDVRLVDATSDTDLGERFERVFIGDVVEHVDDPVRLLRFAKRHLQANGEILVKTPNPHFVLYLWRDLRDGTAITNAEHVSWISPSMAFELARRADLTLSRYFLLRASRGKPLRSIAYRLLGFVIGDSELLNASFLYVYR